VFVRALVARRSTYSSPFTLPLCGSSAIHYTCNSACADHWQTAFDQPRKRSPVKANARRVPGSSRSCRTPLPGFATLSRRFYSLGKSSYNSQTKLRQKIERKFFSDSASISCNENAFQRMSFPATISLQNVDKRSIHTECRDLRLKRPADCCPFSRGQKVGMRDKPVMPLKSRVTETNFRILYKTRQNETNFKTRNIRPRCPNDLQRHRLQPSHFGCWEFLGFWRLVFGFRRETVPKRCHSCVTFRRVHNSITPNKPGAGRFNE